MKIEVFAICYNEEVMLPYFLKHYSQFCDRIVIFDNYSTDRSEDICRQNSKVDVVKYDSGNQIRDDIYLQIKNHCWKKSNADWVIVCDIDEFVICMPPLSPDMGITSEAKDYSIIIPDWYEMVGEKIPETKGQIYEEINNGVCQGNTSKCIMFRPDVIKEINYDPGCHAINPVGDVRVLHTSSMAIMHYKFLSFDYVKERHRLFGERLSEINKKNRWGVQYEFSEEQKETQYKYLMNRKQKVI